MDPLRVRVVFPATGLTRSVQELQVGLRDVSRADAPSPVLAETRTGPFQVPPDGTTIEVLLDARPSIGLSQGLGRDEVAVFAHAAASHPAGSPRDDSARDDIMAGDFLCTVSIPLPAAGDAVVPLTYVPTS